MMQKSIIIENLKINYFQSAELDENNSIIFLHGWKSEASHLKSIYEGLDSFIAIDLPGFGGSQLPVSDWGVGDYARFLGLFIEKLDIQNPILAGHSFGGSVIIKYAVSGGKAKKIVLIGSAGLRKKSVKKTVFRYLSKIIKIILKPLPDNAEENLKRKLYHFIGSDYYDSGNLKNIFKKITSESLEDDMERIDAEAIMIWGENDESTPLEHGRKMNELIKNSKLFIIKDAGHFVFLDKPEEFKKIFDEIIADK